MDPASPSPEDHTPAHTLTAAGRAALTGPPHSAVGEVIDRTVSRVITCDGCRQAWEGANRRAHGTVVSMLTGHRSGAGSAEGDAIRPDAGEVVDDVRQRLVEAGFDKTAAIPDTDRTVTLFETERLGKAQDTMPLPDVVAAAGPTAGEKHRTAAT